jgi:hypothetical protein
MLLLFLIFGIATVVVLGSALVSLIAGVGMCFSKRFRTAGIFVLLVPTMAAASAGLGSWGLAFLVDSLSDGAASPEDWQQSQVLAIWAWPAGFAIGGLAGAGLGLLLSLLIARRRSMVSRRSDIPGHVIHES